MASYAERVINYARNYLGVPYVSGGESPRGFDCSGLVQYVYKNSVGISLPRTVAGQWKASTKIPKELAEPGDLVFYHVDTAGEGDDHIGIYLGKDRMLASPHTGDVVKEQDVYGNPQYGRVRGWQALSLGDKARGIANGAVDAVTDASGIGDFLADLPGLLMEISGVVFGAALIGVGTFRAAKGGILR